MGVMDALRQLNPAIAENVRLMTQAIESRRTEPPTMSDYQESGLTDQTIASLLSPETPPSGIYGAGAVHLQDSLHPAMFVMVELTDSPIEFVPTNQTAGSPSTRALSLLQRFVDGFPSGTVIVGLPRIVNFAHAAPWGEVQVGEASSTLGVRVIMADGRRAITTAGHGARFIGDQALVDGALIGSVAWTQCRELSPTQEQVADLAVVALDASVTESPVGPPLLSQAVTAKPQDIVAMPKRGTLRRARVWGMSQSFAPDAYAAWGEVLTCSPMSAPGDSGSPVVSNAHNGACVGHVVGGAEGFITIVQELDYQLARAGVTLRS